MSAKNTPLGGGAPEFAQNSHMDNFLVFGVDDNPPHLASLGQMGPFPRFAAIGTGKYPRTPRDTIARVGLAPTHPDRVEALRRASHRPKRGERQGVGERSPGGATVIGAPQATRGGGHVEVGWRFGINGQIHYPPTHVGGTHRP